MPTDCSPTPFEFAPVEDRRVVDSFDGGAVTSNAGALLLGSTDRAIGGAAPPASTTRDRRNGSSTRSPPWFVSACSASHLNMRI